MLSGQPKKNQDSDSAVLANQICTPKIIIHLGSSWIRGSCHLWNKCKEAIPSNWSCLRCLIYGSLQFYIIFFIPRLVKQVEKSSRTRKKQPCPRNKDGKQQDQNSYEKCQGPEKCHLIATKRGKESFHYDLIRIAVIKPRRSNNLLSKKIVAYKH